jgi:hypothetical protein
MGCELVWMSLIGTEGTFHLRLPMSAHWARPDVSRTRRSRKSVLNVAAANSRLDAFPAPESAHGLNR